LPEKNHERGCDLPGTGKLREMRQRLLEAKSFPPNPVQVLEAVRAVLDSDDLVIVDAGLARLWAGRFLRVPRPRTVFIPPAGVAPGFGFTAALGARLARPEGRVLVLCGDAAFLAACPEVETHRRLGSHVVTVVVRDSKLGWIGHRQEQEFGRRSFVGFRLPNLIRLTKVLGGTGSRLEKGDRLETLLREGFAASGAVVVDCPVDTRETEVLTETWGRPFVGN
jgi:acetolactate synthase-1/2/3 large subunit